MNRLNSRNCFMLFYYQIVTCLLVTCAAAADVRLHVDATACVFQLKILSATWSWMKISSLKRSTGIRCGEECPMWRELGRVPKQAKVPILYPIILSLNILISDCCHLKCGCLFTWFICAPRSAILTPIGDRWLYWGPTRGIFNSNTAGATAQPVCDSPYNGSKGTIQEQSIKAWKKEK